jgi:hypothetical protein
MKATSTLRPSALALLGARPVGHDLALRDALPLADDRPLVDARVLIRSLELRERVDVGAEVLAALGAHAHDDPLAVDEVDDPRAPAEDDRPRILGGYGFHSGSDERSLGT